LYYAGRDLAGRADARAYAARKITRVISSGASTRTGGP